MASSTDPDTMIDINGAKLPESNDNERRRPGLDNIPIHLFEMIMSKLEPIWIYNVSHVCKYTQDALSYTGGGNRIWYDALPSTVWSEPGRYQLISEQQKMAKILEEQEQMAKIREDNALQRLVGPRTIMTMTIYIRNVPSEPQVFPRNRALGGPYQPLCNYRRELIGRFKEAARCNVCLCYFNHMFGVRIEQQWGVNWCNSCLERYTISTFDVARLVGQHDNMIEWTNALSVSNANDFFLETEIEKRLRERGYPNLQMIDFHLKNARYLIKLDTLQHDPLEPARRTLRRIIVDVVQAIWDGRDIWSVLAAHGFIIDIPEESATYEKNPSTFLFFRERWAPTSKLQGFLFPKHLLSDSPMPESREEGLWLPDPSKTLIANQTDVLESLPASKIAQAAQVMVDRLVATDYAYYTDRRIGRNVSNWAKSAIAHHAARIRREVHGGKVLTATSVPPGHSHDTRLRALNDLRRKLDLQLYGARTLIPMPQRPVVSDSHYMSREEFIEADRAVIAKREKLIVAAKCFNRIVLATCKYCPKSGGMFYPPGLEGLLKHFEQNHTDIFYTSDNFGLNH